MRILMVSDDYLPNPGGIAAHVHELTRHLALLGHEVDLIAGHSAAHFGEAAPVLPEGATLVRNRAFPWTPAGYLATTVSTAAVARAFIDAKTYDVCHWHNLAWESWGVRIAATSLPRVFTNHSSGFARRLQIPWRRRLQLPLLLAFADQVIAPSRARKHESEALGYPPARVHFVPSGVDVSTYTPGAADPMLCERYGIRAEDEPVVVPARLARVKGGDVLLRALPEVLATRRDIKVLLLGDGIERPRLERLALELGVAERVVFCGAIPREQMCAHLRLGRIAVLPSRTEGGIPLAALEALACGLPVVGCAVGGLPEIVRDGGNGLLVPRENSALLASALLALLRRSPGEVRAMNERARQSVLTAFDWSEIARRTAEVYLRARRHGR